MCIIVVKDKKVQLPDRAVLKQCFDNNSDGAGFMYFDNRKNTVTIKKGYMHFRKFYKEVKRTLEYFGDVPMILHFRISTSGGVSPQNTHPYPLSSDPDDLQELTISSDIGICHNGVLSKYSVRPSSLCDTQHFTKDF
jgi:predicted glutamine amidotransferase